MSLLFLLKVRIPLLAVPLAVLVVASTSMAQDATSSWRLQLTPRLSPSNDRYTQLCDTSICRQQRQAFVSKLLKVCLNRDKASAGLFSRGAWKAVANPGQGEPCQEIFFAEVETKTLYLELPYSEASNSAMAGHKSIHCAANSSRSGGLPALRPPSSNYDVCASEFFVPFNAYSNQRVLQLQLVNQALAESGFLGVMDKHLAEKTKREGEEAVAAYRSAFESAKTLEAILAFERKYEGNDPQGFIGQLTAMKRALEVEEYRRRYAALQTLQEMQKFLMDYASDDLDGRLPEVTRRLAAEQLKADAEKKRAEDLKAAEANTKALLGLERQIRWCKTETNAARQAIDREQQIGRVSGYVNKQILHAAGVAIVECETQIPTMYEQYRKQGGVKSLAEIR